MDTAQRARLRRITWFYRISATLLSYSIPLLRKVSASAKFHIPGGICWQPAAVAGVPCEWLVPPSAPESAVILYLHGGGGVTGLYNPHRWMVSHLSIASRLRALLPDYRLAPEHPFPAGLEDCLSVYRWMISNGFPASKIAVAGDSAGGYLTISLLLALRAASQPLPAAAVCLSPGTDPTCSGRSVRENRYRDALLSPSFLRRMMWLYRGSHDLEDPLLSPLHADLKGLPPMLIQVGADELLLDDARRFAKRAREAGVDVTLEIWPDMWHAWQSCVPALPEANQAIEHIAAFLRDRI